MRRRTPAAFQRAMPSRGAATRARTGQRHAGQFALGLAAVVAIGGLSACQASGQQATGQQAKGHPATVRLAAGGDGGTSATGSPLTSAASTPSAAGLPAAPGSTAATPSGTTSTPTRPVPPYSPTHPIGTSQPGAHTALAALATLAVKGRAPLTGYSRDQFGPAWSDTDRNGCDTRNDILRRDLVHTTIEAGTHGCVVLSGDAAPDPYTGQIVHFVRGGGSEIDIDHVVALGDAWQKGAQSWPAGERLAFANDPLNLLAVDSSANRQKGDGDAATWLPPNKAFRCAYVARQVGVKVKYGVWVTAAEHDAIARVLASCPTQPLPTGGNPTIAAVAPATTHSALPTRSSAPTQAAPTHAAPTHAVAPTQAAAPTTGGAGTDPRFSTCKDAIAHGFGPYYEGKDPEYAWYRDSDHDGIDCER